MGLWATAGGLPPHPLEYLGKEKADCRAALAYGPGRKSVMIVSPYLR